VVIEAVVACGSRSGSRGRRQRHRRAPASARWTLREPEHAWRGRAEQGWRVSKDARLNPRNTRARKRISGASAPHEVSGSTPRSGPARASEDSHRAQPECNCSEAPEDGLGASRRSHRLEKRQQRTRFICRDNPNHGEQSFGQDSVQCDGPHVSANATKRDEDVRDAQASTVRRWTRLRLSNDAAVDGRHRNQGFSPQSPSRRRGGSDRPEKCPQLLPPRRAL